MAMYRPKPAEPHQLRDAAGIIAVRLHRHRLERIAHMPRLKQLNRKTRLLQRRKQPLRQRTSLEPDPMKLEAKCVEPLDQGLRFARHLSLANDFAAGIHDAHT